MKIRVAHVITRLIVGGAQEHAIAYVDGLRASGRFACDLLSGPTSGPEGTLVPEAQRRGIEVLPVPSLRREVNPLLDPIALADLTAHEADPIALIEAVDEVWTMTSLLGF